MIPIAMKPFTRFVVTSRLASCRVGVFASSRTLASNTSSTSNTAAYSTPRPNRNLYQFYRDFDAEAKDYITPPEPPKDFHAEYLRRPLYGYAEKGNSKWFC